MPTVSAPVNVYSLAFEALSFREQPIEPREPKNAREIADRYTDVLRTIVRSHVDGVIQPPLPGELSIDLLELFEEYNVPDGRSTDPRVIRDFDVYRVSNAFVHNHKEAFTRVVQYGLGSLANTLGDQDG